MMDGIVNILGVMLGLSVTDNRFVLALGIVLAGISNSFGNAAGIHVSQETEKHHGHKEVIKSTFYALTTSVIITILLATPLFFLKMIPAIITSWTLGVVLLVLLGYFVSRINKRFNPGELIIEYVLIGMIASLIGFGIGKLAEFAVTLL